MNRRDFLQVVAAAAAAGLPLDARSALDLAAGASFYDSIERFGNVSLLHFTDCHAQLRPVFFREPSVNLGVGDAATDTWHSVAPGVEVLLVRADHEARPMPHRPNGVTGMLVRGGAVVV